MITAEEFIEQNVPNTCIVLPEWLIEFAKLHVKAALKEASKVKRVDLYVRPDRKGSKYKLVESGEAYDIFGTRQMWKVNKESILNAYPLKNIK